MSIPDCSKRTFLTKVRGMEIFSVLAWIRSCRMWAFFITLGQRFSAASTMDSSKPYNAEEGGKDTASGTLKVCYPNPWRAGTPWRTPDRPPRSFITAGWLVNSSDHFKSETWQNLCFSRGSERNTKPWMRRIKHASIHLLQSNLPQQTEPPGPRKHAWQIQTWELEIPKIGVWFPKSHRHV